jgi:serine/threonine protein kinase
MYAMKVIAKPKDEDAEFELRVAREIRILKSLNCDLIIELMHNFESDEQYYMLFEFCEGIEIYRDLKVRPSPNYYSEEEAAYLFK